MASKPKFSFKFVEQNGISTISFPTEQAKKYAWKIIVGTGIWIGSHFLNPPSPPLPPAIPPAQTAPSTSGK